MNMSVLHAYMYIHHMCFWCCEGQMRVLVPLEQGFICGLPSEYWGLNLAPLE